jgi:cytosine/adenosine deaminase-related metal-dependent hydrolase
VRARVNADVARASRTQARSGAAGNGIIPRPLLIRGGSLRGGPTRRIEKLAVARPAREINAAGRVVMPGFVDCCSMVAFPHFREEPPDEELEPGLNLLRATSSSRLAHRAAALVGGMARHGTTSLEAKSGIALDRCCARPPARRANRWTSHPPILGPVPWRQNFKRSERYLAWICGEVPP